MGMLSLSSMLGDTQDAIVFEAARCHKICSRNALASYFDLYSRVFRFTHLPMNLLPIALCLTVLVGCASAPTRPITVTRGDYGQTQAYATELIQHQMAKHGVPGISIALVDDQRIVWAQGFGFADVERKLPASSDTVYRVGSISKLFTVAAAMQLAEQGGVHIDQPVKKIPARLCAQNLPATSGHHRAPADDTPQRPAARPAQGFSKPQPPSLLLCWSRTCLTTMQPTLQTNISPTPTSAFHWSAGLWRRSALFPLRSTCASPC